MSHINPAEIPGYLEAYRREETARELCFLNAPLLLCGMPVRQFTARHLILLKQCENAFLIGGRPEPEDLAIFLWFVSPEYCLDPKARDEFVKSNVRKLHFLDSITEIYEYLRAVFQDAGDGSSESKHYVATAAHLVDLLAREYGWDDEAILEKPLARLFQYGRTIRMRLNPSAPMFNESDALISKWLVSLSTPK